MNQTLNCLKFSRYKSALLLESRRFAGHNKWSNIKHIKEEKDGQKSELFRKLTNKMKIAITEGGSIKPSENAKLAELIAQAKRANMPASTINTFLEKMASTKDKSQNMMLTVQIPGGGMMLLKIATHNTTVTKTTIQSKIKKYCAKLGEPSTLHLFEHFAHINAEKNCNLDNAMEDAINVGIEDVEEIQEDNNKYFRFKCEPASVSKILTQLQKLDYEVVSIDEESVPLSTVKVNESDLKNVEALRKTLFQIEGVEEIYDNMT